MKFMISSLVFSFVALLSVVVAAPLELYKRDVFVPPVLTPNSESVWKIGSIQNVTWYANIYIFPMGLVELKTYFAT